MKALTKNPIIKPVRVKIPKDINLDLLISRAVSAMAFARPRRSELPVGAAVLDTKKTIYIGCNIETNWQKSWHAEETAIINSTIHDGGRLRAVCIAAERKLFTPCGDCMDDIMEFCNDDALIIHVNPKTHVVTVLPLEAMMPYYPTKV